MIKVLESTANWKKPENGINIILTHADADGLVSAFQIKKLIQWSNHLVGDKAFPKDFIIISSLKAQPEETDRMLGTACKWLKIKTNELTSKDCVWILDRPTFTDDTLESIPKDIRYHVCDHHESSIPRHVDVSKMFHVAYTNLADGIDNCGASLSNECLIELMGFVSKTPSYKLEISALTYISQVANDWDTFRWKTLDPKDPRIVRAMAIQACDKILGETLAWNELNRVWDYGCDKTDNPNFFWEAFYNQTARMASSIFEARLNDQKIMCDYSVGKNIRTCTLRGKAYRIAFMYGMEEFQSMLSQHIFETHPIVDAVVWMNFSGTISIRTSDETDIKANDLAIAIGEGNGFSGGGHPKAAGGRILDNDKLKKHLFDRVSNGLHHFGFEYVPTLFGDE